MRRKRKIILDKDERELILHSTIIKKYGNLEKVLQKYEKVYETDLEDLEEMDEELVKIFKYAINPIKEEAQKEWRNRGNSEPVERWPENFVKCSLCNTKNKFVFYIENINTNKVLNVGSTCIEKFPQLNSINGTSTKEIKRKLMKDSKRIDKIMEFNEHFPSAEELIKKLEEQYNNFSIVIPILQFEGIPYILKEMRETYEQFISNKVKGEAFQTFQNLLDNCNKYIIEAKKFISKHQTDELICTKLIKEWLLDKNKEEILKEISINNGVFDEKTIGYIAYEPFIKENINKISTFLGENGIKVKNIIGGVIYFSYTSKLYNNDIILYMNIDKFMKLFGKDIFISKNTVNMQILLTNIEILWNEHNRDYVVKRFNAITKKLGFFIKKKQDDIKIVIYEKMDNSKVAEINFQNFIATNKSLLFINNKQLKEKYKKIANKITWKDKKEMKKYNISSSDISSVFTREDEDTTN